MKTSVRVLVVYNFDGCRLGQIGTALREAGAEIDLVQAHLAERLPRSPEGYDAILVLGGTQNAVSDELCPWQPHLVDLMRVFGDSSRSVLGVCLGSQLLARAYGGRNIIGGAKEFGWREVELTTAGGKDTLFAQVPGNFPIFQWHDDTFTLPQPASHLARGDAVSNQAFRIGRAAYGVQFHFEADRKLVSEWSREFKAFLAERQPDWADRHPIDAERFGPESDATGLTIARNWVRTIIPKSWNGAACRQMRRDRGH
jgi:GMP synthase-like glutamine amidotransferase